jgi:hypothetical protein
MIPGNQIGKIIVDAAIEVHGELGGPGPLDDVYEEARGRYSQRRGAKAQRRNRFGGRNVTGAAFGGLGPRLVWNTRKTPFFKPIGNPRGTG